MSEVGVWTDEREQRDAPRKLTLLGVLDNLNQTLIAVLAAAAVVVLVLVVALLMAFIEYQSRLLRYQPGIRSSEIIQSARREIEAEEAESKERAATQALKIAAETLARSMKEAQFLTDRVCSVFIKPDEPDQRRGLCYRFLSRVPFDGTLAPPAPGGNSPASADDARTRREGFNKAVLAGFVRAMADGSPAAVDTEYLSFFNADILRIALLNQDIFTKLSLDVDQQRNAYQAACLEKVELNALITYVDAPPASCLALSAQGSMAPASGGGGGSGPPPPAPEQVAPQPAAPPPGGGYAMPRSEPLSGVQLPFDPDRMEKQRRFDLVRQFRIYNDFTRGIAQNLLLSPPDYLATWLLIFGGALGSMLKIIFRHLMPTRTVRWSDLLVDSAQGLVCAVILFILFRSGVVVISGPASQSNDTTPLSPYFVAFLAIGAGLMSDQVINAFRSAASSVIGRGDVRQPSRWAVGLAAALDEQAARGCPITNAEIAARLAVMPDKVQDWRDLRAPVESTYQDALRLVLGTPLHELFTDIDPRSVPLPVRSGPVDEAAEADAPGPAGETLPASEGARVEEQNSAVTSEVGAETAGTPPADKGDVDQRPY